MTNRASSEAILPRPVPVMPVAKPRGKVLGSNPTPASNGRVKGSNHPPPAKGVIETSTTPHYANQQPASMGAVPKSVKNNQNNGDTDTMTKTKAILNEAADAVAKSFAKQTQGINKGKLLLEILINSV